MFFEILQKYFYNFLKLKNSTFFSLSWGCTLLTRAEMLPDLIR